MALQPGQGHCIAVTATLCLVWVVFVMVLRGDIYWMDEQERGEHIEKIKAAAHERMRQDDSFDPALSPWSHGDEV